MDTFIDQLRQQDWYKTLTFGSESSWITEIFLILIITMTISFFVGRSLNKLKIKLTRTKTFWDDVLVDAMYKPAKTVIWLMGLLFATKIAMQQTNTSLIDMISPARSVIVISTISWFLLRFILKAEEALIAKRRAEGKEVDVTTMDAVTKLLRLSVMITSILVILQTLGFSVSGILAFGGIGGIAVGFAAKDLLANFFGGMMIYLDRPFTIGDWIRSPDRDIEGTVEAIGWRQTRIRTFDKRPLYVPNSVFSTIAVQNPSRMICRRFFEYVGVRYDDIEQVQPIVDAIKAMLIKHEDINENHTLIVNLERFNASSVDIMIYCFTHTSDWIKFHEVKQKIMLEVATIISDHQAEFAFPTSTLHVPDGLQLHSSPEFSGINHEHKKAS